MLNVHVKKGKLLWEDKGLNRGNLVKSLNVTERSRKTGELKVGKQKA